MRFGVRVFFSFPGEVIEHKPRVDIYTWRWRIGRWWRCAINSYCREKILQLWLAQQSKSSVLIEHDVPWIPRTWGLSEFQSCHSPLRAVQLRPCGFCVCPFTLFSRAPCPINVFSRSADWRLSSRLNGKERASLRIASRIESFRILSALFFFFRFAASARNLAPVKPVFEPGVFSSFTFHGKNNFPFGREVVRKIFHPKSVMSIRAFWMAFRGAPILSLRVGI